ncbi:MarR family winged helix-turn-helix transcriptional regulator [Minwuia thermotolerans]|uniref:MarR family transcriptional regulator n=1 Tax=Minwuia thermotolerans TaxID=2056226 RepID=A0A2M9G491_9PROT|nr:MarR family transcriptional regulator [Minwuia thermotolerans]PJK30532.1 MarR family transcriptional regulator [Minwuia thermotolerans]
MIKRQELNRGILPSLVGYNLRQAQIAVFKDFADSVGRLGITPGQFGVLELIANNEGLSQSALARALDVDRSTIVGVLDRLQEAGLVQRRPSPRDRRSHELHLSPRGAERVGEVRRAIAEHEGRMLCRLSAEERARLLDLLGRIR